MKKGSVSIVVLVVGIIALCILSLFIFIGSNRSYKFFANDVYVVERTNSYAREILFQLKTGRIPEENLRIFEEPVKEGGYVFEAIKKREGEYLVKATKKIKEGGILGLGGKEIEKFSLEKKVVLEKD